MVFVHVVGQAHSKPTWMEVANKADSRRASGKPLIDSFEAKFPFRGQCPVGDNREQQVGGEPPLGIYPFSLEEQSKSLPNLADCSRSQAHSPR